MLGEILGPTAKLTLPLEIITPLSMPRLVFRAVKKPAELPQLEKVMLEAVLPQPRRFATISSAVTGDVTTN